MSHIPNIQNTSSNSIHKISIQSIPYIYILVEQINYDMSVNTIYVQYYVQ